MRAKAAQTSLKHVMSVAGRVNGRILTALWLDAQSAAEDARSQCGPSVFTAMTGGPLKVVAHAELWKENWSLVGKARS